MTRCVCLLQADEWEGGHVSCAQRLPVQDDAGLVSQVVDLAEGNMATPVVTYCYSVRRLTPIF